MATTKETAGLTRDLEAAKAAYTEGDTDASKAAHDGKATANEEHSNTPSEFIKSMVRPALWLRLPPQAHRRPIHPARRGGTGGRRAGSQPPQPPRRTRAAPAARSPPAVQHTSKFIHSIVYLTRLPVSPLSLA